MVQQITPYKRGVYPTIEGNERVFFDDEFRKIEQTLGQIYSTLVDYAQSPTIASGVISLIPSFSPIVLLQVDTEASGATDDLDTINNGRFSQILIVKAANSGRTVVMKDGTGNLNLAGDFSLDNAQDTITLMRTSESNDDWRELARSDNGA